MVIKILLIISNILHEGEDYLAIGMIQMNK